VSSFDFKKVISDRFFQKNIVPIIFDIFDNTSINRVFLTSYWQRINETYYNSFSKNCVVYTEHEITKGIERAKPFYKYTDINLLGNQATENFDKLAKENNRDLQVYNYLSNMPDELKFFSDRNNITCWLFRIVYKKTVACYALHATSSDFMSDNKEDKLPYTKDKKLENYLYQIANILEQKINTQKRILSLF